jgi:transposase
MRRLDVTDAQWQRLEPLLPPEKPRTGRPNHDHRRVVSGMLWIHRTGAPWRDLPERYGPVGTVSSRFYRWVGRGFGTASSAPFRLRLTRGARSTGICTLSMPRSFALTSTPPARAGPAPSGGEAPDEALGRSQGGFSTKIHLRAEGHGRPITAVLTGGERHEQIALADVLDRGAIPRSGRGRPRRRPRRVAGDKGYSSPTARRRLRQRRISPVIPSKSNQRRQPHFDRAAYRLRNRVERLINRLKQFRRIATRYEKRAANYLAMLTIGMILLWI